VNDFFTDIEQIDVEFIPGVKGKLPLFYREARALGALLPANIMKLRRLLPDPRFKAAQIMPGVGGLLLGAFEYRDTDIGPYNEFAVAVLTNSPLYAGFPGYNLLRQAVDRFFSAFVVRLPVTTEVALKAGVDNYNFPKFIADIEFTDSGDTLECALGRDGERILSISCAKASGRNLGEMLLVADLYQYRKPQFAEIKANVIEGAIGIGPRSVSLHINTASAIGREISQAIIAPIALAGLYFPRVQAVLYGPESYSMPLLGRALAAAGLVSRQPGPSREGPA
jgi:hypothetical protein